LNKQRENDNIHHSQKSVALMEILVKALSFEGACILDPFMGSGSTIVACHACKRSALGIELEKEYFDYAQERHDKEVNKKKKKNIPTKKRKRNG
jgi:DNA modification methylase